MKDLLYEKHISSSQGTTYYWTNDPRGGEAMVFLPGLTADHSLFDEQIEAFNEDRRILILDQ